MITSYLFCTGLCRPRVPTRSFPLADSKKKLSRGPISLLSIILWRNQQVVFDYFYFSDQQGWSCYEFRNSFYQFYAGFALFWRLEVLMTRCAVVRTMSTGLEDWKTGRHEDRKTGSLVTASQADLMSGHPGRAKITSLFVKCWIDVVVWMTVLVWSK